MATITLKGNPIHTNGELPKVGNKAPSFVLTNSELEDVTLGDFSGKRKLINIFPSLDTSVCALSTKKFNAEAANLKNVAFLMVSADLPFAMGRFCQLEGLTNVVPLAMMRSRAFADDYGVLLVDGPLAGITARAVVVLDEKDKVLYTELVSEIAQEPNYEAALKVLQK